MSAPPRLAVISMVRSLRSYFPLSEIEPGVDEIVAEAVWWVPSGSIEMVAVELPDLNLKSKPLPNGASLASTERPAGGVRAIAVRADARGVATHQSRLAKSAAVAGGSRMRERAFICGWPFGGMKPKDTLDRSDRVAVNLLFAGVPSAEADWLAHASRRSRNAQRPPIARGSLWLLSEESVQAQRRRRPVRPASPKSAMAPGAGTTPMRVMVPVQVPEVPAAP